MSFEPLSNKKKMKKRIDSERVRSLYNQGLVKEIIKLRSRSNKLRGFWNSPHNKKLQRPERKNAEKDPLKHFNRTITRKKLLKSLGSPFDNSVSPYSGIKSRYRAAMRKVAEDGSKKFATMRGFVGRHPLKLRRDVATSRTALGSKADGSAVKKYGETRPWTSDWIPQSSNASDQDIFVKSSSTGHQLKILSSSLKREGGSPSVRVTSSATGNYGEGRVIDNTWQMERVRSILQRVDRLREEKEATIISSWSAEEGADTKTTATVNSMIPEWKAETQWTLTNRRDAPPALEMKRSKTPSFIRPRTSQMLRKVLPIGIGGRKLRVVLRLETRVDSGISDRVAIAVEAYDSVIDCLYQLRITPPERSSVEPIPQGKLAAQFLQKVAMSLSVEGATQRNPGSLVSSLAPSTKSLRPRPSYASTTPTSQSSLFIDFEGSSSTRVGVINDKLRVVAPVLQEGYEGAEGVGVEENEKVEEGFVAAESRDRTRKETADKIPTTVELISANRLNPTVQKLPSKTSAERTLLASDDDRVNANDNVESADDEAFNDNDSTFTDYSDVSDVPIGALPSDLKKELVPILSKSNKVKRSNSTLLAGFSLISGELKGKGVAVEGLDDVVSTLETKCSDNEETSVRVDEFLSSLPKGVTTFLKKEGLMSAF